MTPDTEKPFDALPICACAEFYDSHPPDCPVRRHIEQQAAEIARLKQLLAKADEEMQPIDDDAMCDHGVGICWCAWNDVRAEMREALSAQPGEKQS